MHMYDVVCVLSASQEPSSMEANIPDIASLMPYMDDRLSASSDCPRWSIENREVHQRCGECFWGSQGQMM